MRIGFYNQAALIKTFMTMVSGQRLRDPVWLDAWKPRRTPTGRAVV